MKFRIQFLLVVLAMLVFSAPVYAHPQGIDPTAFELFDQYCQGTIDAGNVPGITLLIGRCPDDGPDSIIYEKAYGNRVGTETMTLNTLFDLASVTKPTFTASAVMFLIQDGEISAEDFVSTYIPGFEQNGKDDVRIRHLLTHTSGLAAYTSTSGLPSRPNPDALINKICGLSKSYTTGEGYTYSCLNFITLARIVENVTGETVTTFLKRRMWDKIGMIDSTHFPTTEQQARTAPTLYASTRPRGRVHDPLAWYYTDYVNETHACGNAGGFSTVLDESRLARLILRNGWLYGKQIYTSDIIDLLTTPQTTVASRSFGWGTSTSYYARDAQIIGHSGYTGTYIFIDLTSKMYFIMFTNYVYPNDDDSKKSAVRAARSNVMEALFDWLDYYNDVPEEAYVIDNEDGSSVYTESGDWETTTNEGYGRRSQGYRYSQGGQAGTYADFNFPISESGLYRLNIWYRADTDRSTSVRYQVNHRDGTTNIDVNQQSGDQQWNRLGYFEFDAGENTVRLDAEQSSADGIVIADAIRVEPIALDNEVVVDNSDPGFAASNNFGTSSSSPYRYGEDYHYLNPGLVGSATWTLDLPESGVWEILQWHNGNSTRSDSAPFTITHLDGQTTTTVNQQENSGQWISLGEYAFLESPAQVTLSGVSDKILIADAIKARKVSGEWIVDDLDVRFTATDGFFLSGASTDRYDATYRACETGSGEVAAWNLELPWSGYWRIEEMHNGTNTTRTTNAPFRIIHAGGESTVLVNQQENSGEWNTLGYYRFEKSSGRVVLSNEADSQYVIADAIRAVYVGSSPSFGGFCVH